MSLFEKIKKDRIEAMKAKETVKKDLLSTLLGDSSKESKEPSDEKVIATIKKFIKSLDEVIVVVECGSPDYQKFQEEKEILSAYLPKQLTDEGIVTGIKAAINLGANDIGAIQKFFKDQYPSRYDGGKVSKFAKEILNG